jgi:hypothetical protein
MGLCQKWLQNSHASVLSGVDACQRLGNFPEGKQLDTAFAKKVASLREGNGLTGRVEAKIREFSKSCVNDLLNRRNMFHLHKIRHILENTDELLQRRCRIEQLRRRYQIRAWCIVYSH